MNKIYQRVNKRTGEVVQGRFEDICDLDVRLWDYAELVSKVERIAMTEVTSTIFDPNGIRSLSVHIPVNELLNFMRKSEALNRIKNRNRRHFKGEE